MKKLFSIYFIMLVLVFGVFPSGLEAMQKDSLINDVYAKFASSFKNKKFDECLRCFSDKDFQKYKEIAKFNDWNGNVDELLLTEIQNVWDVYYDEDLKKVNIKNLKETETRNFSEMQDILNEMKANNATKKEINEFTEQMELEKFNSQEQILLMQAKVNTFRDIIEKKIINNRAIIAVEFEYVFPKKLERQVRTFFVKEQENSQNISKIRQFNAGVLRMYYLYVFEQNSEGQWQMLFFSRDEFDETGFEDFIDKYEKNVSFYDNL